MSEWCETHNKIIPDVKVETKPKMPRIPDNIMRRIKTTENFLTSKSQMEFNYDIFQL